MAWMRRWRVTASARGVDDDTRTRGGGAAVVARLLVWEVVDSEPNVCVPGGLKHTCHRDAVANREALLRLRLDAAVVPRSLLEVLKVCDGVQFNQQF